VCATVSQVWNKANVQSVGGGFLVVDPHSAAEPHGAPSANNLGALRFFVGARTGLDQIMGNASVGFATLRRDGFASYTSQAPPQQLREPQDSHTQRSSPNGTLITRPLVFTGRFLFINMGVDAELAGGGAVRVAVLNNATGMPIAPYQLSSCNAGTTDSTRLRVQWDGATDVSAVSNRVVQLQFEISGGARLYSFWVSASEHGESNGFVAAGGKGFCAMADVGSCVQDG
jgi:hypothetical protein